MSICIFVSCICMYIHVQGWYVFPWNSSTSINIRVEDLEIKPCPRKIIVLQGCALYLERLTFMRNGKYDPTVSCHELRV